MSKDSLNLCWKDIQYWFKNHWFLILQGHVWLNMDVWEHWYSLKLYFELRCFLDGQITCILFHWLLFWWFEDYPRRPLKGNFRMAQKQNKQQSSKSGCLLLSDCSAADNADGVLVELLTMPAVTVHVSAWWLASARLPVPIPASIYFLFFACR